MNTALSILSDHKSLRLAYQHAHNEDSAIAQLKYNACTYDNHDAQSDGRLFQDMDHEAP